MMNLKFIYFILAVIYVWYRAILLFIAETKKEKKYPDFKGKISIIIPVYNEKKYILLGLIESLLSAIKNIDSEIIIGDDGSKIKVKDLLSEVDKAKLKKIKIMTFKHRGKRETQKDCIELATGEIIITMDSDILTEKNSIYELIKPFNDSSIGAVTGQVKILNEDENWLTKATSTLYWNAFNVTRKSLSTFGVVNICSGALSAYRKKILIRLMPKYINQIFLGKKCVHGDDRTLTNMVLKEGYKIEYVQKAICYTISPPNLIDFIKQQYRWRQSTIREGILCLGFSFRDNKLLFFETVFMLTLPFLSFLLVVSLLVFLIFHISLIINIFIGILIITIIHNIFLLVQNIKKILYAFLYTILNFFILYWLWPIALINVRSSKWGTR